MTSEPNPTMTANRYQDQRSPEWAARCTVPPSQLGRTFQYEAAVARYGEEAIRPLVDGFLTADDLGRAVVEDLAALGPAGRAMVDRALDDGIDSVDGAPESLVTLFKALDNPPAWVDFDQLRHPAHPTRRRRRPARARKPSPPPTRWSKPSPPRARPSRAPGAAARARPAS